MVPTALLMKVLIAAVRNALSGAMTVEKVLALPSFGEMLPKTKLEIVVPAERADAVVAAITTAARTGKLGDGKIFVFDIGEAIRIRNGDRGELAL